MRGFGKTPEEDIVHAWIAGGFHEPWPGLPHQIGTSLDLPQILDFLALLDILLLAEGTPHCLWARHMRKELLQKIGIKERAR